MQDFKFHSYVEFFEALTEDHQVMTSMLKELVYEAIPDVKEKLSWNVPFFYKKKSICYIWPGCIPWGKKTYKGVTIGFTKGYLMKDNDFLEQGDRKQIASHTFQNIEEIEDSIETLLALLKEANDLDK